jgi:hypothetical protein
MLQFRYLQYEIASDDLFPCHIQPPKIETTHYQDDEEENNLLTSISIYNIIKYER